MNIIHCDENTSLEFDCPLLVHPLLVVLVHCTTVSRRFMVRQNIITYQKYTPIIDNTEFLQPFTLFRSIFYLPSIFANDYKQLRIKILILVIDDNEKEVKF